MRIFIVCTAIAIFGGGFLTGCGQQTHTTEVYTQDVVIEQSSSAQDTSYMDTGFEVVE